ncbi:MULTISPECIES: hypothetical protein [unclassified Rhizobium]|uniref:hypothetical protein n=1 Tax=unclassified Rhizobium TaxID=2613769 RepID=UPI001C83D5D1|nr:MULTISPECIES: hypothetical protein [unclassified Rhizobium]MBX5246785.1 hypothetical protein [Rhizobium sp. NLR3b]MBX5270248.1 hypothetical protein [Rhizobium sp. NLR17b]MBX5277387.1 hypothetical protein [Rhizobium sp. NLR13a]
MSKRIFSSMDFSFRLPLRPGARTDTIAAIRDRSAFSSGKLRVGCPDFPKALSATYFGVHPFRKPQRALAAVECRQHLILPSSGLTSNQSNLI